MHSKNREVTLIILQKNMRSMHSSEKIEELETDLEGYRWDAILLSETWRHEPAEIWETRHNHIFMGAGKYENNLGVGIMLNRRWRKTIVDTNYISERAIKTRIMVNRRRIDLMSVYFRHSKYADHHIENMYKNYRETHAKRQKVHSQSLAVNSTQRSIAPLRCHSFSDSMLRSRNMVSEPGTRKNDSIDSTQDAAPHHSDEKKIQKK